MIDGQLQIEWEKLLTNTDNPKIKLNVRSIDYGSLSTEVSWNLLHDERCPRDLPRQLATHFKNKMGMKIDKLKRLLVKHASAVEKLNEPTSETKEEVRNDSEIYGDKRITFNVNTPTPEVTPEVPPPQDDFDLYKLLNEEKEQPSTEEVVVNEENKKGKKKNKKK